MIQTPETPTIINVASHIAKIQINQNPIVSRREIIPDKLDDKTNPQLAYAYRVMNTYTVLSTPATQLLTSLASSSEGDSITVSSTGALAVVKNKQVTSYVAPKDVTSTVAPFVKDIIQAILSMKKDTLAEFTDVKSQIRDLGILAVAVVKASNGYDNEIAAALKLSITGYFTDTIKLLNCEMKEGEVSLRIKDRNQRISVNNESINNNFKIFKGYECAITQVSELTSNSDELGSLAAGKKAKAGVKVIRNQTQQKEQNKKEKVDEKPKEEKVKVQKPKTKEIKQEAQPVEEKEVKKVESVAADSSGSDDDIDNSQYTL